MLMASRKKARSAAWFSAARIRPAATRLPMSKIPTATRSPSPAALIAGRFDSLRSTAPNLFVVDLRQISKPLHFNRVARWIAEEHGRLLTCFTREADAGGNDEFHFVASRQGIGELAPVIHLQDDAQMRHRHHVRSNLAGIRHLERFAEVQRQLMAEEINVHPGIGASAFFTAEQLAVEVARDIQIVDVIGEMEE